MGGAQELYGVTPDLSVLGKGMANGYAISAVTGKADSDDGCSDRSFLYLLPSFPTVTVTLPL